MAQNTGKPAEAHFVNTLNNLYGVQARVVRFEDASDLHGMNGRAVKTSKKPSDYLVTVRGVMEYAEVKSSVDLTSFRFSNISTDQLKEAIFQRLAGGRYTFYVYSVTRDTFYTLTLDQIEVTQKAGKASIKWDDLPIWSDYESYKEKKNGTPEETRRGGAIKPRQGPGKRAGPRRRR